MRGFHFFMLLACIWAVGCNNTPRGGGHSIGEKCTSAPAGNSENRGMQGALLATRFNSLEELKSVIQIEYFNSNAENDSVIHSNCSVHVKHCSGNREVVSVLEAGVSQEDIWKARYGEKWTYGAVLVWGAPFAVRNRKELEKMYTLSRRRPEWFGEGDPAFFDIAKASVDNINTPDLAFKYPRDTTEKGYLNSFNHIAAQAFITTCFSEELADFIADAHERQFHPELIIGKFTAAQLNDLNEGPVDNYVDLINNEWGQELGKQLKDKYHIQQGTNWTPEMLANYLNDLQSYYSWAFQIGFEPFRADDEVVVRFSSKINSVMRGVTSVRPL